MWVHGNIEQRGVNRVLHGIRVDAQSNSGGTLRIEIDDKHTAAILGQRASNIDGAGGLTYATLLVAHGNDARRTVLLQWFGCGEGFVFTSKQIGRHTVYLINIHVPGWCNDMRFVHGQRALTECAVLPVVATPICHA